MTKLKPNASRGSGNKINNIGLPIVIKSFLPCATDEECLPIRQFKNSVSAEEQLGILKSVMEEQKNSNDDEIIHFLTVVLYEAPAKHPVKCLLTRHVTKCTAIQQSFTTLLTAHIISELNEDINDFEYYSEKVPKIMMCIENFPCGALAVERVGLDMLTKCLFFNYFFSCRGELRKTILSPTKKNEMFNLEHTMLRLIVHVIQKLNNGDDRHDWGTIPKSVMDCVKILITDEEVPMDTKSLSGILLLSAESLRIHSGDAWKTLLEKSIAYSKSETCNNEAYDKVLKHKIGRLVVYSAIATTIPMTQLQEKVFESQNPAMLMLLEELLSYADGRASEPAVTVAVSRALVQLSRALGGAAGAVGGRAVDALLRFVWRHLEFQLDSVRHLANQILAACLDYCAELDRSGESGPLESMLRSIRSMGEVRSVYWAVSRAAPALGSARVLRDLCDAPRLLRAAAAPHLHAAAKAAISAVLSGGACAGLETREVFKRWVRPALDSPAALQAVLPAAVVAHPPLVQYIGSHVHGRAALACVRAAPACRACLTQRAIRAAAIHADDETRILALSLVAECGRSTAGVSRAELACVLWSLRHALHAPRPAFRTALLANINKLLKRLDDSDRALRRRGSPPAHYAPFLERLRALCFAAALRGASHGRRSAALQLLAGTDAILPHITRVWKAEYVETLLHHLDDSYDSNQASALQVLQYCPLHLLECSREMSLAAVLRSAVSLRAASGAAAAVKLQLLLSRMPHRIAPLPDDVLLVKEEALRPHYAVLRLLLQQLRDIGAQHVWQQVVQGGAPATTRCIAHVLRDTSGADWRESPWSELCAALVAECVRACQAAEPVVSHHAPEGYLPALSDSSAVCEGARVTAQMVLVCAWRTVRECAGVLGALAARGPAAQGARAGDYLAGLLRAAMHRGAVEQAAAGLELVAHACWGEAARAHLPRRWARDLLALASRGAPHATRRGAGLPAALQALVSSEVSATGRAECFNECMEELLKLAGADTSSDSSTYATDTSSDGVARRTLAANILRALYRHSALEKVSQAFVPAGLRLALNGFEAAAWPERTAMSLLFCALCVRVFGVSRARGALHARNTLPAALFFQRYARLYDLMASKLSEFEAGGAAGPAVLPVLLLLARLHPAGGEGAASSLKVSAFVPLVQRCACASELRIRQLAARALPALLPTSEHASYIERLLAAVSRPNLLYNHWHGALLTLVTLLERATTPHSTHFTASGTNDTPDETQVMDSEHGTQENNCEPYLTPNEVQLSSDGTQVTPNGPKVTPHLSGSVIALTQALGPRPCYVVAREYVSVLNLLIWKYPKSVPKEFISTILKCLDDLIFAKDACAGADRELCLADCTLLYFIIIHKENKLDQILPLVTRTLRHPAYEVVLSTLDYLLVQHDAHAPTELCNIQQHLLSIRDDTFLKNHKHTPQYITIITSLSDCFHNTNLYNECRLKSLKLLTLEKDTQMLIINEEIPSNVNRKEWLAHKLISKIEDCHENVKHMYLESVLTLARESKEEIHERCLMEIHRVMYECSSADNSDECRMAVVRYLESGFNWYNPDLSALSPSEQFRCRALALSTLVTLLEDDDDVIRQRVTDVITRTICPHIDDDDADDVMSEEGEVWSEEDAEWSERALVRAVRDAGGAGVCASAAGALLRRVVAPRAPLLLLVALLEFRAEVRLTDHLTDECRVFDQSERYNIFLEECAWTASCADTLVQTRRDEDLVQLGLATVRRPTHADTFAELCDGNVELFERMARGEVVVRDNLNPKIEILVNKLRRR